jgi:hypothetical protein
MDYAPPGDILLWSDRRSKKYATLYLIESTEILFKFKKIL